MKFDPVAPEDVPNLREAHRGRVSYPILKSFLETGMTIAKLDRTGIQQSTQSLYSSLGAYIRNHELPIKLFMRNGQFYLLRLDLDADGAPVPDWKERMQEQLYGPQQAAIAAPIDANEVEKRFAEEQGQVTK